MTIAEAKKKLIRWAISQIGYEAGSGKKNIYADILDGVPNFYNGKKNGFDWCDVFVDCGFYETFGENIAREMLYQPKKSMGAGCAYSANYYRINNAFFAEPELGDQVFFGEAKDEDHTGIVIEATGKYIYTVEGNTGGGNGSVLKKVYNISDPWIAGYGRPKWRAAARIETNDQQSGDINEVARQVIAGTWGNGSERYAALRAAGWDPDKVQEVVNKIIKRDRLIKVAEEVISGAWGNGSERYAALRAAGWDPDEVQEVVNNILRG